MSLQKSNPSVSDLIAKRMTGATPLNALPVAPVIPKPARKAAYQSKTTPNIWVNYGLSQKASFDWVLPSVRTGQVCILYSPGGTGKSFWALQAAVSIASGVDCLGWGFMGHQIKRGPVSYISLEDGEQDIGNRLSDIFDVYPELCTDKALDCMKDNLAIQPMSGANLDLMNLDFHKKGFTWKAVTEGKRLLVIDTFSQAHRGNEMDPSHCSVLIQNLLALASSSNAAVLVLHHTSKASAREGDTSQQAARGSSVLTDGIRNAHFMAGMTKDELPKWKDAKGSALADKSQYVKWGTSKHNASAGLDNVWYHRSQGGVLKHTILSQKEVTRQAVKPGLIEETF